MRLVAGRYGFGRDAHIANIPGDPVEDRLDLGLAVCLAGDQIIDVMKAINAEQGTTFIFSTHDARVMSHADRVIRLEDGRIAEGGKCS